MFPTSFARLLLRLRNMNEVWLDFASHYERIQFSRGQMLPTPDNTFYLLQKGAVRTSCIMPSGQEWIWLYQGEGCLLHEIDPPQRNTSIIYTCLTPVRIFALPRSLLTSPHFYQKNPQLVINYLETLAFKEAICHSYCYDLSATTATGRVCQALLALSREAEGECSFAPKLSQTEIGSMMALHPTSVARSVRELRAIGAIGAFTKNKLEILSHEKLEAIGAENVIPQNDI